MIAKIKERNQKIKKKGVKEIKNWEKETKKEIEERTEKHKWGNKLNKV